MVTQNYSCKVFWLREAGLLLLLFLTLFSFGAFASDGLHMAPIPLADRVKKAETIVEGEVISKRSFWDARQENIYTSNIIKVYKVFKGNMQAQQVELITEGGSVGLKKHVYSSALELQPGQQGVFFMVREQQLRTTPGSTSYTGKAYGSKQGLIRYDLESGTADDVFNTYGSVQEVYNTIATTAGRSFTTITDNIRLRNEVISNSQTQNSLMLPVITNFTPTVANAGVGTVLTINGTNFGATRGNGSVAFRNADNGGRTFVSPLPSDYISWSNTQIRVRIPSRSTAGGTAGTGQIRVTGADGTSSVSTSNITIEYAYSNVDLNNRPFRPVMINTDREGGYTIQFAPTMQSRGPAQLSFSRAMNSWVCNTNVNWKIGTPTNTEAATDDGQNVIRFAPASVTGDSVLARTISRYEGCRSGNDTLFWLSEFDMELNSAINWQYGPSNPGSNQYDFETVVLHELGHAHQLSHVILPRAVMHYAIPARSVARELSSADITGAAFVMARSTVPNICNQPRHVARPEGDCNLSQEIYSFEANFVGNNAVEVLWTSSNETENVASFLVQRSENGEDWTTLATVPARGPAVGILEYNYTDTAPLPRISYYRIQTVYNDNSTRNSVGLRVLNPAAIRVLSVYPNPISPYTEAVQLEYLVQSNATASFQLIDMTGKIYREFTVSFTDLNLPITMKVNDLAAGVYILKWSQGDNSGEVKLLKL